MGKANTSTATSMVRAILSGLMVPSMMVCLWRMIFTEEAITHGMTIVSMMGSGTETECMGKGFSVGAMVASSRDHTSMIKRRVTAFSLGQMVVCMTDSGKAESSMGLVPTLLRTA